MGAGFGDGALFEEDDAIGLADGAEAVSNDKDCAVVHGAIEGFLHQRFGFRIQGGGGFVEDQDARVKVEGTGDRDALPLSARQVHPAFTDPGVIALRELGDEIMGVGELGGGGDAVKIWLDFAVGNVLGDVAREQGDVLGHDADLPPQAIQRHGANVDTVDQHLPVHRIKEAHQQIHQGGFTGPGGTDQGNHLAGMHEQIEMLQDGFAGLVSKGHIAVLDLARHRWERLRVRLFRQGGRDIHQLKHPFYRRFRLLELVVVLGDQINGVEEEGDRGQKADERLGSQISLGNLPAPRGKTET